MRTEASSSDSKIPNLFAHFLMNSLLLLNVISKDIIPKIKIKAIKIGIIGQIIKISTVPALKSLTVDARFV